MAYSCLKKKAKNQQHVQKESREQLVKKEREKEKKKSGAERVETAISECLADPTGPT